MKDLYKKTARLLRECGHSSFTEALEELRDLQQLSKARTAEIKIEPPSESAESGNRVEIHGHRFVILRFSRVVDSNRAHELAERTGLPVVMIHEMEGLDVSVARLEPLNKKAD